MAKPAPTLHPLVLVLCHYNEQGQGVPYREQDCTVWFSSLDRCNDWIQDQPRARKFYSFPLRNLAAQLAHLKEFRKDGVAGVICDPKESGSAVLPIDELTAAIEAELANKG